MGGGHSPRCSEELGRAQGRISPPPDPRTARITQTWTAPREFSSSQEAGPGGWEGSPGGAQGGGRDAPSLRPGTPYPSEGSSSGRVWRPH